MSRDCLAEVLFLLLLIHNSRVALGKPENNLLEDGNVTTVSLMNLHNGEAYKQRMIFAPSSNTIFNVINVPPDISFAIFQIHTYQYNVTLSYDKEHLNKVSNRSIFGSNTGLYIKTNLKRPVQMFLKNDNVHLVEALLVVTVYDNAAPVPGGCNMEFNTEVAPYEKLVTRDGMIIVDTQPGSLPITGSGPVCEKSLPRLEVYQLYLREQDFSPETYFSGIESMLTVEDIVRNGRKTLAAPNSSAMRRVYSAYTGVGTVYVAVITYEDYSSAYVPAASYACSPALYPETCEILSGTLSKLFCGATFFLGFFSIFFGPRYRNANMVVPIFLVGSVISYGITVGASNYATETNILLAVAGGFIAILLWMVLNTYMSEGLCTCTIFSLTPGLLFASIVYTHSPDALILLGSNWAFWALFATVVLSTCLIMGFLSMFSIAVTCALFGSYMMVLPIDYYAGSSLKYIIINLIRRATVPEFGNASVQPPFQTADAVLAALWVCLFLLGVFKHICPKWRCLPQSIDFDPSRLPLLNARATGRANITYT